MISLLDVAERAYTGPRTKEMEWNMGLFKKMRELTKRHHLQRPLPTRFYEVDEAYLDALFDAAVDFLSEMGVYCTSTNRVIQFTESEVREAARQAPNRLILGEGRDTHIIRKRAIGDRQPTHINTGGHSPWSEDLLPLPLIVRELTRIPRVGSIEGFNFVKMDGREVHGTPKVVYAARRAVEQVRAGVQLAGRPGLAVCYYPILTSAAALIAPIDPARGLRRSDGLLLSVLPDLKVESDLISAAIVHENYGCYRVNGGAGALVGGFCGDAQGAMIESVSRNLTAWLVYRDQIQYSGYVGVLRGARSREGVPAKVAGEEDETLLRSLVVQLALRRNTSIITYGGGWPQNGGEDLCSEEHLIETALACMRSTALGHNIHLGETPPPTTVAWAAEVSDATLEAGLKLPDLYEVTQRIRREKLVGKTRIEHRDRRILLYQDPEAFLASEQKCYDIINQRPREEFLSNKRTVTKYLQDVGLPLP
jgi:methylamine--corrinoid protein Co-methyltransferase